MTATASQPVPGAWGHRPSGPRQRVEAAIVLFERDRAQREELASLLPDAPFSLAFEELADADGVRLPPDIPLVVVLGPAHAEGATLDQAAELLAGAPGRAGVVVARNLSALTMRLAMRGGFDDALDLDEAPALLASSVTSVARRAGGNLALLQAAAPAPARAFVTSVFSPKGGVGKSVVAVNLAAGLASRGGPVVVVDLDLQFGDVALMLRLVPHHTLVDAVSAGELLDEALLRSFLVRHEPSGIHVLAAPTSPSEADQVTAGGVLRVLSLLAGMFSHIVIDTPPQLSETVLQAASRSDLTCFVVGMDVPSVKSARVGLQAFELIDVPRDKLLLVLNRSGSRVYLTAKDVEKVLGTRADVALPSDICVPQSVNQGTPAVVEYPSSAFSEEMSDLVGTVMYRASRVPRAGGGGE